jgi:hypothetical protein
MKRRAFLGLLSKLPLIVASTSLIELPPAPAFRMSMVRLVKEAQEQKNAVDRLSGISIRFVKQWDIHLAEEYHRDRELLSGDQW